jgi:hypothetical protein
MANAGSFWSLSFEMLLVLSLGNEFEPGIISSQYGSNGMGHFV